MRPIIALALVMLVVVSMAVGCTPKRNRIKPPFPYQGDALQIPEMRTTAISACNVTGDSGTLPEPHPFTTDGCSLWPDGAWRECCVGHDVEYWCAGAAGNRKQADRALRDCVRSHSGPANAFLMYWGVRLGGAGWLPVPWRWGYGYPWLDTPDNPSSGCDRPVNQSARGRWAILPGGACDSNFAGLRCRVMLRSSRSWRLKRIQINRAVKIQRVS